MRIAHVTVRNFRNYEQASVAIAPGLTVVHGPVAAGKTNLLEAIYFGCVGRSFRTSSDRELVRFGERATHVGIESVNGALARLYEVGLEPGRAKLFRIDGARSERPASLDERPPLGVFAPDRLELVKGPASVRRAHLDRLVAALWPTRAATRSAYARALAQRNALLARIRGGVAAQSLGGWDHELARQAIALMGDRREAVERLALTFSERAAALGLEGARIRYRPRAAAETVAEMEAELLVARPRDVERGFTTHGPHRDDFSLEHASRELRRFGSQGQQRLGLLALLLAERDVLCDARGDLPVLLLDDVLSELDGTRRTSLFELLRTAGQALVTTADPEAARSAGPDAARVRIADGRIDA